jgi:hypothetical protein
MGTGGTSSGDELARGHVGEVRGIRTERYRDTKIQGRRDTGSQNTDPKNSGWGGTVGNLSR